MAKDRARYERALRRGFAHNGNQQWQEAIFAFRVAIGEFPEQPAPYAGLGEACFGLKQLDKALECYKLAARYSRGEVVYLQRVADIQERLGLLTEAGQTYFAVAEVMLRRHQLDEAINNWQRAVRLDPNLLSAHRRLAMVFQRRNNVRDAVREYLAIARILQMQGEKQKALFMCQAALRLDPGNTDVLKAVELIQNAESILRQEEEEEAAEVAATAAAAAAAEPDGSLTGAVRQMAAILASERQSQSPVASRQSPVVQDPISVARRQAQDQLAEEIFIDEDEEDWSSGSERPGLSKLERDALIGQGMDFESRGQLDEAITCYERAVAGGLSLPAAYFTLALLYHEKQRYGAARSALERAMQADGYREAGQILLKQMSS